MQALKAQLIELARVHGFDLCAVTRPTIHAEHQQALQHWVDAAMYADMDYMAEPVRLSRRKYPEHMLEHVQSVICVGMRHAPPSYTCAEAIHKTDCGVIASYAHGDDYHEAMKKRLKALAIDLDVLFGAHDQRVYVDTAPVLEHALAADSGMAWQGKHSLSIHRDFGSYLMLGEIFTTAHLPYDAPATAHCGSCTACIDSCPTQAIVSPFIVDARRCISYWTIEHKGAIPHDMRRLMGNRIFGCDDCQLCCPWNRKLPALQHDVLQVRQENILPTLQGLWDLSADDFSHRFRRSPVKRLGRNRLRRNIAVAMGNSGNTIFISTLLEGLSDTDTLVRGHSAWALAQLYPQAVDGEIAACLRYASQHETDAFTQKELQAALLMIGE